ncbi:hypothetical protein HYALB_00002206 [Hymenoscyphus albidus]|uniref:Uncharacterized protein n=1 Tax=Hymenoscyphus albidus TaxID=595503 RepID=A0A9N9LE25_9HELO|nr:hypothetical protein HYALB_00002206 [Hymenoscyphus albidus]
MILYPGILTKSKTQLPLLVRFQDKMTESVSSPLRKLRPTAHGLVDLHASRASRGKSSKRIHSTLATDGADDDEDNEDLPLASTRRRRPAQIDLESDEDEAQPLSNRARVDRRVSGHNTPGATPSSATSPPLLSYGIAHKWENGGHEATITTDGGDPPKASPNNRLTKAPTPTQSAAALQTKIYSICSSHIQQQGSRSNSSPIKSDKTSPSNTEHRPRRQSPPISSCR